MPLFWLLLQ